MREAHPGENLPSHRSYEQKREQAEFFLRADGVPWLVLVDDVEGSVARAYTTLPNAQFLIDVEGRVSFRGDVAHGAEPPPGAGGPVDRGGRGVISDAEDRQPHMLGPMVFGWDGVARGGTVSKRDLWKGAPPMAANLSMGNRMKPLLGGLAARRRPVSAPPASPAWRMLRR